MEPLSLSDVGPMTRLFAGLVSFAVIAAMAAFSIMVAMMVVLLSSESGNWTSLTSDGDPMAWLIRATLVFGVACPLVLLVVGVSAVYCFVFAILCFAISGLFTAVCLFSKKRHD